MDNVEIEIVGRDSEMRGLTENRDCRGSTGDATRLGEKTGAVTEDGTIMEVSEPISLSGRSSFRVGARAGGRQLCLDALGDIHVNQA